MSGTVGPFIVPRGMPGAPEIRAGIKGCSVVQQLTSGFSLFLGLDAEVERAVGTAAVVLGRARMSIRVCGFVILGCL